MSGRNEWELNPLSPACVLNTVWVSGAASMYMTCVCVSCLCVCLCVYLLRVALQVAGVLQRRVRERRVVG